MPRPREYDLEYVLDTAVSAFWKHGFVGTSIRDLVDACGLTTRSMYDAFGGKTQFFEAALDHYYNQVLAPVVELLRTERGLVALERLVGLLEEKANLDGCLFVNTGAERNMVSPAAIKRVEAYTQKLCGLVRDKLEEARSDGHFRGDSDTRAKQFFVSVAGFNMALKCGLSRGEAAAALRALLRDIAQD